MGVKFTNEKFTVQQGFHKSRQIITHVFLIIAISVVVMAFLFPEAIVLTVDISPPIASEEEIIDKYTEILQQNPQIKLAIIGKILISGILCTR